MRAGNLSAARFVRKTQLGQDEYRKNFRQIDSEIIEAVSSTEADTVTPLMSKVYLRLMNAPNDFWEREGVLRFTGEEVGERWTTAWAQLVSLTGVSSATARKALMWMHDVGIIGYYAGKNGVGIRIFLNRAASSIGQRPSARQKNLRLVPALTLETRTSAGDTPFMDSFAVSESLDTEFNPASTSDAGRAPCVNTQHGINTTATTTRAIPVEEIVSHLKAELEHRLTEVATQTASRTAQQEMESTRRWFELKALPKAVRVAQRETYNLLRKESPAGGKPTSLPTGSEVGRRREPMAASAPKSLTGEEVREAAEMCIALFETQGKSVRSTLAECEWLLVEDVPRVRAEVDSILRNVKERGTQVTAPCVASDNAYRD